MDAIADPITRYITLVASTQVGKTLAIIAAILYLVKFKPANALVVLPDRNEAVLFRERLYAMAKETGYEIPPEWRWNLRHMDVGGMRIYLAWSGSRQGLRGKRCKYVFMSEVDVFARNNEAGDPIEAAQQRVKAFPSFLIFRESSPIPEVSRIDRLEEDTNGLRWHCECPHCGKWQQARFFRYKTGDNAGRGGFGGMDDGEGNLLEVDDVRKTAHYVCVNGCKITSEQKRRFLNSGRWVAAGQRIVKGKIVGKAKRGRRDVGARLWSIHSDKSFGDIAAEYVIAVRDGKIPDFWQNWLGQSHKTSARVPKWTDLAKRMRVSYYHRGKVPKEAWFLIASGDTQKDGVYFEVRAYGDRRTSWLVDWYYFPRFAGDETDVVKSDLAQIESAVLRRWYDVEGGENPRGQKRLQVVLSGIDTNYRNEDLHLWKRSLPEDLQDKVRHVRGEGSVLPADQPYKLSVVKQSKRERDDGSGPVVYEGGLELWLLNSNTFRLRQLEEFNADPDKPGAWLLPADILEAGGTKYMKQVTNRQKKEAAYDDGRPKYKWDDVKGGIGHDYWDCTVNSKAIAQMFIDQLEGDPGWDASKWPTNTAPPEASPRAQEPSPRGRVTERVDRAAR